MNVSNNEYKTRFKTLTDWQRYILKSDPKLPVNVRRPTLIAFCFALASHGTMGLDCYAGNSLLADELGISRRYLKDYRQCAIDLGWFVANGRKINRIESLDIAIPTPELADAYRPVAEPESNGEPVADPRPWDTEPSDTEPVERPWFDDARDDGHVMPWDKPIGQADDDLPDPWA